MPTGAAEVSTRPLPRDWLHFAAVDGDLLVELRDLLAAELVRQGKAEWAAEEFAALVAWATQPPRSRPDPWRRTSGIHKVRGPRALARVRALWYARDAIAVRRDTAPGRILPDSAIVAAAESDPKDERILVALAGFGGRSVRPPPPTRLGALHQAREAPGGGPSVPPPPQ